MTAEPVILAATVVSACATVAITYYAFLSYKLTKAIHEETAQTGKLAEQRTEERHRELADLYQALVIAMMQSGPGAWSHMKEQVLEFKKHYSGTTAIFRE